MDRHPESEEDRNRSMGLYRGIERHSIRMALRIIMDTYDRIEDPSNDEQRVIEKRSSAAKCRQMGYTLH